MAWAIERLRQLRGELGDADTQLRELDRIRIDVRETMLRLLGAIQVLEEMVATSAAFGPGPDGALLATEG